MQGKTFTERTEILEQFLTDCADDPARIFMLTSDEAVDLLNLIGGLREDNENLRDANKDWADTAADLRDDLHVAKTGLRGFAKEAAFEREFANILQGALKMAQDERDEAQSALRFANDTGEYLLLEVGRLTKERNDALAYIDRIIEG